MSKTSDDVLSEMLSSVQDGSLKPDKKPETSITEFLDEEFEPEETEEPEDEPSESRVRKDPAARKEPSGEGESEEEGAQTPEEIAEEAGEELAEEDGDGELDDSDEDGDEGDPLVAENEQLREALNSALAGFPLDDLELPGEQQPEKAAARTEGQAGLLPDSNPWLDQLETHMKVDESRFEEILSSPENFYEFMKTGFSAARNSVLVDVPYILSHWQRSEGAVHSFFAKPENSDIASLAPYVRAIAEKVQEKRPTMEAQELLETAAAYVRKKLKVAQKQSQSKEVQTRRRGKSKPIEKKNPRFAGSNKRRRSEPKKPAPRKDAGEELLNRMYERNR